MGAVSMSRRSSSGASPPHLHSITQIAAMLGVRILDLCHELLPAGRRDGQEWEVGSLAGEPGRSCKVHIGAGHMQGRWKDFASDDGGDALDLVAGVLFRGDKSEALRWARGWLGLDTSDPAKLQTYRRAVERQEKQAAAAEADEAKRADLARRIFAGARAGGIAGTLAETYLERRAIRLRDLGRAPGALAFSAQCWNRERNAKQPAMLAAITLRGKIVAVHRTYLTREGAKDGALLDPKLTLGTYRGGYIPLWRPNGSPSWSDLWKDGAPETAIVIAEGIENALSVAVADPSRRVAATVSLSNMAAIVLPPCVTSVIVAADNDIKSDPIKQEKIDKAFKAAMTHLKADGRAVSVARAPMPHKDFNDWLQALARASGEAAA